MKPRDLSLVLKDAPAGEWIALSMDETRIVGHGTTIEEAVEAAKQAGEPQHILIKMPLPNFGIAAFAP
jgi:S-methylmethionine-dependent homocysteine/selenocysteine methylase